MIGGPYQGDEGRSGILWATPSSLLVLPQSAPLRLGLRTSLLDQLAFPLLDAKARRL